MCEKNSRSPLAKFLAISLFDCWSLWRRAAQNISDVVYDGGKCCISISTSLYLNLIRDTLIQKNRITNWETWWWIHHTVERIASTIYIHIIKFVIWKPCLKPARLTGSKPFKYVLILRSAAKPQNKKSSIMKWSSHSQRMLWADLKQAFHSESHTHWSWSASPYISHTNASARLDCVSRLHDILLYW